ncbi:hypothetical protein [Erysipelothrix aquatica]|uniref:hypothetical protein n=1 Tax=Erysipelothrix aquatica TaxID=2683714 RepID=UPI00135B7DA3|nr:hypothetical protein [Erysipelothrix aquatica]
MEHIEQHLVHIISEIVGSPGREYHLGKFEGLAWFLNNAETPVVSLKKYDKTVNVYAMTWSQNHELAKAVETTFGKSAIGKSCIRIRKLTPDREQVLKNVIQFEISR